jgi:hypothetical protein
MKKTAFSFVIALFFAITVFAQTNTSDFLPGSVTGFSNEKTVGSVKQQLKQRGIIVFAASNGKKTAYTPNEIQGFEINGEQYISYSGDFYKILVTGAKLNLLQKLTDNNGKIYYNGSQPIATVSVTGKINDYYLQQTASDGFFHITAENYRTVAEQVFASNATILASIKSNQTDYSKLAETVKSMNISK